MRWGGGVWAHDIGCSPKGSQASGAKVDTYMERGDLRCKSVMALVTGVEGREQHGLE